MAASGRRVKWDLPPVPAGLTIFTRRNWPMRIAPASLDRFGFDLGTPSLW